MKTKFKIQGKEESVVTIEVSFDSKKSGLTRWEILRKKRELQNEIHAVLRNFGFDIASIKGPR